MTRKSQKQPSHDDKSKDEPAKPIRTIHDDVDEATDTCSCEPEPRWQQVGEELEREARDRE